MEANPDTQESTEEPTNSNENSQDSEVASKKSEENSLPSNLNLIQVEELDNETIKKMKGDAIGDTLYSERFVLKTLMELKEQNGKKIEESFEKVS
jgi:hypothetical protein